MWIVMKDGPKKGEVQEMKFAVANALILAGRAELYNFETNGPIAKAGSSSADPPAAEASDVKETNVSLDKKKKKKR